MALLQEAFGRSPGVEKIDAISRAAMEELRLAMQIISFAAQTTHEREARLPFIAEMVSAADGNAVNYLAEARTRWQFPIEDVASNMLATPLMPDDESGTQARIAWGKPGAIVVLSQKGVVMGMTPGRSSREDMNLALTRALYGMHVGLAGRGGGIATEENREYLVSLGVPDADSLFGGAVDKPLGIDGELTLNIGTSGWRVRQHRTDYSQPQTDKAAGNLAGRYLWNPNAPREPFVVPSRNR